MRVEVKMPNMGYDMEEGIVQSWLVDVGTRITRGMPIAEIETDKATVEMEALTDGTLVEIICGAGQAAPVGDPIAIVETDET